MHVVCEWIGNSEVVAKKHYLQITEEHFARASKAVQNPVQQGAKSAHKASQKRNASPAQDGALQDVVTQWESVNNCLVGPPGFEPGTKGL